MTTHAEYGPDVAPPHYPQHPPSTAYPTAPPWASPLEPAPVPSAVPSAVPPSVPPSEGKHGQHEQHGQLIVPFPEEMHNASRPSAPTWWPVVARTAFVGLLGIVSGLAGIVSGLGNATGIVLTVVAVASSVVGIASASRRASQARRGRNSPAPYWAAWAATMAVLAVVGVAAMAVGVPVYLNHREGVVTKVVQSDLTNGKQLRESAGVTATSAICKPVGPRDTAGSRLYNCTLALDDGRTGTLMVTAGSDGRWTAVPK